VRNSDGNLPPPTDGDRIHRSPVGWLLTSHRHPVVRPFVREQALCRGQRREPSDRGRSSGRGHVRPIRLFRSAFDFRTTWRDVQTRRTSLNYTRGASENSQRSNSAQSIVEFQAAQSCTAALLRSNIYSSSARLTLASQSRTAAHASISHQSSAD
jgi:hypothetical protein